ncbi:MAG: SAM-dependent methyltransferase [Ignavibacteria bacterium]|jgi:16S rRNA (cytidine1402-2'-O)-methyltransferase|nr:SAM-dependent methyltransferase [Ignavibacteria bacterium]
MGAQGNNKKSILTFADILKQEKSRHSNPGSKSEDNKGKLIIVTTPLGDFSDLTINALNALSSSDYIICEEFKVAKRLLKFFEIDKELFSVNEHNQTEPNDKFITDILGGKKISLISDCGTPGFADPGIYLIRDVINYNLPVEFIHGSNSVLSAVTSCGFDISRFYFAGFLSPKKEVRRKELQSLKNFEYPFVLMDTPYRLKNLLGDLISYFPERDISLAMNLSTESEKILHGKPGELMSQIDELFRTRKVTAEFVIVVNA